MRQRSRFTRHWARWLGTVIGFPLAGVAARAVAGDIDTAGAAALGGAVGGAVLGTVQVLIGGIAPTERVRWIAATAAGFAGGLSLGAATVDFATDAASLTAMGALTGAGVGLAQALSITLPVAHRLIWTAVTPATWAFGWLITSQVIVDAERRHAIFGSSGAVVVCALTGLLVAGRDRLVRTAPQTRLGTGTVVA